MKSITVADLGQMYDGPHATPTRRDEGPYFLNIASLNAGRLDLSQSDHVSDEDFEKWTRRVTPQAGDLLFSYETRLGEAALMPEGVDACLGRRMALIRPDRDVVEPRYLLYRYLAPDFQRQIDERAIHGATVSRIGLATMGAWPVDVHDLAEQRAIAEVLGALDDKIAANEDLVQRCDQLRGIKVAEALTRSSVSMVPLSETADFVNGRNFTKDATGAGRPVIRIAELNGGLGTSTVYNDVEVGDSNVARPGDFLFAWSGSLTLRRWHLVEGVVNQHIFKVIPKPGWPLWLVASLLERQLHEFKVIAADKATTMGHIQRRHLDVSVPVPSSTWIESEQTLFLTLWACAVSAELEARKLAALRDALLPELMSGRLTVKDAESQVEEVV